MASGSGGTHGQSSLPIHTPAKFHPSKSFAFPSRNFGSKGEKRSFRAEWCEKYDWLHYDRVADAAFCHLCMITEHEKKFLASTKRDPAFIIRGYIPTGRMRLLLSAHTWLATVTKKQ